MIEQPESFTPVFLYLRLMEHLFLGVTGVHDVNF